MPICQPCHPEHTAAVCDDTIHGRTGVTRRCYCQHRSRPGIPVRTTPNVGATGHPGPTTIEES